MTKHAICLCYGGRTWWLSILEGIFPSQFLNNACMYVILTLFLFAKMMLNFNDIGWIMIENIFLVYLLLKNSLKENIRDVRN